MKKAIVFLALSLLSISASAALEKGEAYAVGEVLSAAPSCPMCTVVETTLKLRFDVPTPCHSLEVDATVSSDYRNVEVKAVTRAPADDTVACIQMIESREVILSVPAIDPQVSFVTSVQAWPVTAAE